MIDTTQYPQLLILKRHWTLAVVIAATVMAVAIPVALGAPNVYRASAKLTIERQTGPSARTGGDLETRLQEIRQDALSRARIIDLIDELDLYPELRQRSSIDVVIDRVQKDISVTPQTVSVGNGSQITMSFTVGYLGNGPEMVAAVANRLAATWVEQNTVLRTTRVSRAVHDLELRMKTAQTRVDDANQRMTAYMQKNASQLPESMLGKMEELQRVNQAFLQKSGQQTQLEMQRMNLEDAIAAEARPTTMASVDPDQSERARLKSQINEFVQKGERETGPNLKILLPQLKIVEDRIAAAASTASGAAPSSRLGILQENLKQTRTKLATLNEDIVKLDGQAKTLRAEVDNMPARLPQYEGLKNEVAGAQEVYASAKKDYDRALLDETTETAPNSEEFKILEPARVPQLPAGPNRLNLIVIGVFAALVLGIGGAILRDQLDTSFHTIEELRTFTTVPIIGSIPRITTAQQKTRRLLVLGAATCGLIVGLGVLSVATYHYAQRHEGITRIVSK